MREMICKSIFLLVNSVTKKEPVMPKAKVIKAKIEPQLKKEVEAIFERFGLSATDAISLFYHQVKLCKRLPFDVRIPNRTTIKTFKDTDAGKNLVRSESADDMFNKLNI
jgi:DNA-damage-inducible protein J